MLLMIYLLSSIGFICAPTNAAERIVGGRKVSIDEYPYQLSLRYNGNHICGAALISDRFGITAAHCIYKPGSYSVRAGSADVSRGGVITFVDLALLHPLHSKLNDDYDIAILKFFKSLPLSKTIQPVKLPQEKSIANPGTLGYVSGWGATSPLVPLLTTELRAVEVPVLHKRDCQQSYIFVELTPRMICAGYKEGRKDACQGDSGGPYVINGVLYGIVSWGFNCAQPGYPGVYTYIPVLRGFIKANSGV